MIPGLSLCVSCKLLLHERGQIAGEETRSGLSAEVQVLQSRDQ